MNELEKLFIRIAKEQIDNSDPSHDIWHSLRVYKYAIEIARHENADLDIVIPASLFHDIVSYPKNDPREKLHGIESWAKAEQILQKISTYPQDKIKNVVYAIAKHTWSELPETLEWKVLRDADELEVLWSILVMRAFSHSWVISRPFYDLEDPFGEKRELNWLKYTLDYIITKSNTSIDKFFTNHGKELAKQRIDFIKVFLTQLKSEIL